MYGKALKFIQPMQPNLHQNRWHGRHTVRGYVAVATLRTHSRSVFDAGITHCETNELGLIAIKHPAQSGRTTLRGFYRVAIILPVEQ